MNNFFEAMSKVCEVRERLQDEESLRTYEARIRYMVDRNYYSFVDEIMNYDHVWRVPKLDMLMEVNEDVNHIVIYGAGKDGEYIYKLLSKTKYKDMDILFCDRDINKCTGARIISPQELIQQYRDSIVIIGSSRYAVHIWESLSYSSFPSYRVLYPFDHGDKHLFALTGNQYFDFFAPTEKEVFIDAGCFNGNTSVAFSEWCGDYEKIYAFEPNENMIDTCKKTIKDKNLRNVELIQKGVWSKTDILKFYSNPSNTNAMLGGAKISETGNYEVRVDSIDNVLDGRRASYIKMDIEGSEYSALVGAERTIKEYKPKLAISVYHKPEDIIELPALILKYNSEYKFGMRHYASNLLETVLYAF